MDDFKKELIEPKCIYYLPADGKRPDVHVVKEVVVDENGTRDRIRTFINYKRPFHITKKFYRDQFLRNRGYDKNKEFYYKKEAELLSRVDTYKATDSELLKRAAQQLHKADTTIKNSPFVYGLEVDGKTHLLGQYRKRNANRVTPYRVGVFDIENDVITGEITIIGIVTKDRAIVVVLKSFLKNSPNYLDRLTKLYEEHIPDVKFKHSAKLEVVVMDSEINVIKQTFRYANSIGIDILTGWNIIYDFKHISARLLLYNLKLVDIIHYGAISSKFKVFKIKEAPLKKITDSGKEMPVPVQDAYDVYTSSTNYKIADSMKVHRAIRNNDANIPGGYGLDNILKHHDIEAKLRFDDNDGSKGFEWHYKMSRDKPLEYIIYNIWDCMSILVLDDITEDLSTTMATSSEGSHVDVFSSGPKRLVDAMHYFYKENGYVLGVKANRKKPDKLLRPNNFIITLQSHMLHPNVKGIENVRTNINPELDPDLNTAVFNAVLDDDITAAYPSAGDAWNVSTDTTHRELRSIVGMDRDEIKPYLVDFAYGVTNINRISRELFNSTSVYELDEIL